MGKKDKQSDMEFIEFVETHSITPRPMFKYEDAAKLYELAGHRAPDLPSCGMVHMPKFTITHLIDLAKIRINAKENVS